MQNQGEVSQSAMVTRGGQETHTQQTPMDEKVAEVIEPELVGELEGPGSVELEDTTDWGKQNIIHGL